MNLKKIGRLSFAGILILSMFSGCKGKAESSSTSKKAGNPFPGIQVTSFSADLSNYNSFQKTFQSATQLNKEQKNSLFIDRINEDYGHFQVYANIISKYDKGYIPVLLMLDYSEESIAYIITYNSSGKYIDHKEVFYDNSEGMMSVTSRIDGPKMIFITTEKMDSEKKEIKASIQSDGTITEKVTADVQCNDQKFNRTYTQDHLNKNPDQTINFMEVKISECDGNNSIGIQARVKNESTLYTYSGLETESNHFSADMDRGAIYYSKKGEKILLSIDTHLIMDDPSSCKSDDMGPEVCERSITLQKDSADDKFLLSPVK